MIAEALSSSFGAAARAYVEHRPDYAPAAGARGARSRGRPARPRSGAGTSKLTAALVEFGADVVAVEPDPTMLAQLRRLSRL